MSLINRSVNISWSQFEVCNPDTQNAFEKMCSVLFNQCIFNGKKFLHSNPNNPGVEIEPILDVNSNKCVSFQAKYFSRLSNSQYLQIEESMKTAVSHYKGRLDVIYLYCNKDLNTSNRNFIRIKDLLDDAEIELILINNQSILNQVLDYAPIASYYFNSEPLTEEWFVEKLENSVQSLGPRYNNELNVETRPETELGLFLKTSDAVSHINEIKNDAKNSVLKLKSETEECEKQLENIFQVISDIVDVDKNSVLDCLGWKGTLEEKCSEDFKIIQQQIDIFEKEIESTSINDENYRILSRKTRVLKDAYACSSLLEINKQYERLLNSKVLVIKGDAGVGKSHLLANMANKGLKENRYSVLLLGYDFLTSHTISEQIISLLQLDMSLDLFLNKLECLGELTGNYVCIYLDALNETANKDIWKTGLISFISKIETFKHIKLVLTVRTGYEKLVFNESIIRKLDSGDISKIVHIGFREESVKATMMYLNHYGIPCSPSYFLYTEMTNPLFLSLFCKHYKDEVFDIFKLFDRVIKRAEEEAMKACGYSEGVTVIQYFIEEMANVRLYKDSLNVKKSELLAFKFWETAGLNSCKLQFISSLEHSGLLISSVFDDEEIYHLGYNLLEDFVCAKTLVKNSSSSDLLLHYFSEDLLKIENGEITKQINIDIFIVACALFAEKYGEECIDSIIDRVTNEYDKEELIQKYIDSFLWRNSSYINFEKFLSFIRKNSVSTDSVFKVFIENSTKENHPLNADALHKILFDKTLSVRDYIWTIYINGLSYEEERLFQLIAYFDRGETFGGSTKENIRLLLILFIWLLSSSNRKLRDKASKAAIELLKRNFEFSEYLLQSFKNVNDPYIIQRLYGVIFGACTKTVNLDVKTFKDLASYIYETVFNCDIVYPDILLRDYARLILERFMFEFPTESSFIDENKITPPYNSEDIPMVEKQEYYKKGSKYYGYNEIDCSMMIDHSECSGMYGDFGRYTFQSALNYFDNVDIPNLYHYAMQFIRDNLGYKDDLFAQYDSSIGYFRMSRHDTKKIERIGKKYQWIAFYNILARVSDKHLLSRWDNPPKQFEGCWDPYVRDFDPTLNVNCLKSKDAPNIISSPNPELEFLTVDDNLSDDDINRWTTQKPLLYENLLSYLILKDSDDNEWLSLNLYKEIKFNNSKRESFGIDNGSQQIWFISKAFFIRNEDFDIFNSLIKNKELSISEFPDPESVYSLFNREYDWSSGYLSTFTETWKNCKINKGDPRVIIERGMYPEFKVSDDGSFTMEEVEQDIERTIYENELFADVLPSCSRYLWEEEYDASQPETTSYYVPSKILFKKLKLVQKEADGYFYNQEGELVCFDSELVDKDKDHGFLMKKECLLKFLEDNNLRLVWTFQGEKQYFMGFNSQKWKNWLGLYYLDKKGIKGEMWFE